MHVAGWPVKRLYLGALDSYDELLASAAKPWYEVSGKLRTSDSHPPTTGKGVLADLLLPALQAAYSANARDLAVLRSLRIFNALTQYRDEHGHEASRLADLSLPKEATIDPFSGEPLKVKHTDEGWIIYSVMQNGVDDGGISRRAKTTASRRGSGGRGSRAGASLAVDSSWPTTRTVR